MAIKHSTAADVTFSVDGATAWDASHDIEVSTIATQHLGGDITATGAGLLTQSDASAVRVYLGVQVSSAAFTLSTDYANSTHIHSQYQTTSTLSSAAYTVVGDYASSTHALRHITGGDDAIAYFNTTSSGLAPPSGTSTANFLKGDGTWSPASGGVAWGAITGTVSDQTDLGTVVTTNSANWALSSVVTVHVALANPHTQYQMTSSLSSAAYQVTSHFAISSIVVTHVALSDPHTQYQLETGLSTGAFQLSSHYAISTHATRHITGGADVIPNFTATESGLVPLSGGGTANFLRADGSFAAPSGGSDPWTYLRVSSAHVGVTSVAFKEITSLQFTPDQNSTYYVEMFLMLKTSTATVNPRIQFRWPTNCSSVGWINVSQTNSSMFQSYGNETSTQNTLAAGGLATTTAAWPCIGGALINTYGATASSFGVMMATETAGAAVSTMIGSHLKYRVY